MLVYQRVYDFGVQPPSIPMFFAAIAAGTCAPCPIGPSCLQPGRGSIAFPTLGGQGEK